MPARPRGAVPRTLRIGAALVLALFPIGAGILLLTADGWAVNRWNVRAWTVVTAVTGGRGVITPEVFAVLANVALFVPLCAALAVLVPRWIWVLVIAALSTGVEAYQSALGTRTADVGDVLANTAGAVLGVALGRGIRRLALRAQAARTADAPGAIASRPAGPGVIPSGRPGPGPLSPGRPGPGPLSPGRRSPGPLSPGPLSPGAAGAARPAPAGPTTPGAAPGGSADAPGAAPDGRG